MPPPMVLAASRDGWSARTQRCRLEVREERVRRGRGNPRDGRADPAQGSERNAKAAPGRQGGPIEGLA